MRRFAKTLVIAAVAIQPSLAQEPALDADETMRTIERALDDLSSPSAKSPSPPADRTLGAGSAPAPASSTNEATAPDASSTLLDTTEAGGPQAGAAAAGATGRPSSPPSPTVEDATRATELRARLEALRAQAAGSMASDAEVAEAEAEADRLREAARLATWRAETMATLRAEIGAADLRFLEDFVDRERDRERSYSARERRPVATLAPEARLVITSREKMLYASAHADSVADRVAAGTVLFSLGITESKGVLRRLVWVPGYGPTFVADVDLEEVVDVEDVDLETVQD